VERVLGIGGFFFRSVDPAALNRWYLENLGIDLVPQDYETPAWQQEAGTTVWAAFPKDTGYLHRPEQQWMVNFRVRDLGAMLAQLRAAGVEVVKEPETHPNGIFAHVLDPEGNPIELWEPAAGAVC